MKIFGILSSKLDAEYLYCISVVFALGLLFFANADQQEDPTGATIQLGIGKSFYFPCGIALITSFFLKKRSNQTHIVFNWMICLALVSSLIHPPLKSSGFLSWTLTRFVLAILCFKDVSNVNPFLLSKLCAIVSPFIVFPHYILTNPFLYGALRYGGFYGDANFFALSLLLVMVMCYITIIHEKSVIVKLLCWSSIIGSIPLVVFTMSRGGIIGLGVILYFLMVSLRRDNKKLFFLFIVLTIFSISSVRTEFADLFSFIGSRFSNDNDSDSYSTMARFYGMQSGISVLLNCPYLIPFGIGLGNTVPAIKVYAAYGYFYRAEIHNTFISLLYEGGLIIFLLYVSIYFRIFFSLIKGKNYVLLGLLFSTALSLFTLPGVSFMPGWISLFFLSNKHFLVRNHI